MSSTESLNLFHIDGIFIDFKNIVLELIHSKHLQRGLRHNDYQRYRRYCRDKVAQIRRSLKTHKKTKQIYQKHILTPQLITDSRHLTIPLFCAERCWAHSNEIKNLEKQNPKRRQYIIRKLKKFCKFAYEFNQLVEKTRCDLSTKWEAKAYYYWALSTFYLSCGKWEESLNYTLQSKSAYEAILGVSRSETREIYQNRIEELTVSEKYCSYNLKGLKNAEELHKIYSSTNYTEFGSQVSDALLEARGCVEKHVEIEWLDKKYFVQAQKAKEFIINLRETNFGEEMESKHSFDSKLEIYDKYLLDCKEALVQLNDFIHSDQKPTYFDERYNTPRDLEQIYNYLTFLKISLSSQRNHIIFYDLLNKFESQLVSVENRHSTKASQKRIDTVRPEHFIRIFDQLIQNSNEILNVKGVHDSSLKDGCVSSLNIFNACRCYFGAILMQTDKRFKDAVCLLYKSLKYFGLFKNFDSMVSSHKFITKILSFEDSARSLKIDLDVFSLSDNAQISATDKNKSILERLYEITFDENSLSCPLISVPCPLIPIPCDPVIKNTAESNIIWPTIEIEQQSTQSETEQPYSFTNYVKSWIWGSS
ncbi:hypothetical protein HZS_5582 [Henneguya salminicola]|nr:hypothetical protein HZS_5582 [Henneguya salminicola]